MDKKRSMSFSISSELLREFTRTTNERGLNRSAVVSMLINEWLTELKRCGAPIIEPLAHDPERD